MQHLDRSDIGKNVIFITFVNNSLYTYDGLFTAVIDVLCSEDEGSFTISDEKGRTVEFEVVSIDKGIGKRILSPINLPGVKQINRYTVRFRTKVKGMTRKTLL